MPLFRRDPAERAAKQHARWLRAVPDEGQGAAAELLFHLPDGWELGRIDRERYRGVDLATYGLTLAGPGGEVRCGVGLSPADAIRAALLRLQGELAPTPKWAPPTPDNVRLAGTTTLEQLERDGGVVHFDTESYGVHASRATGAGVATATGELLSAGAPFAAAAGDGRRDEARAALAALLLGELEPTELWALR